MNSSPIHKVLWLSAVLANGSWKPSYLAAAIALVDRINSGSGLAWARMSTLAADAHICEKTVQRAVKFLSDRGFLVVRRRQGTSHLYQLAFPAGIPISIESRLDSLVRTRGPVRPVETDSTVRKTCKEQNQKQSGQETIKKTSPAGCVPVYRILQWRWGSRRRLLGSPEQACYESELRDRLASYSVKLEDLPDDAVEHLLQLVREGALISRDLGEAKKLAADLWRGVGRQAPP